VDWKLAGYNERRRWQNRRLSNIEGPNNRRYGELTHIVGNSTGQGAKKQLMVHTVPEMPHDGGKHKEEKGET